MIDIDRRLLERLNPITEGAPAARDHRMASVVELSARWLTISGVALAASIGFGRGGIGFGDVLLTLALGARFLQLLTTGLPLGELRKHDVVLWVAVAIALGGFISGVSVGEPMPVALVQQMFASFVAVFVVAMYATNAAGLKELVRAYAVGNLFLALSGFVLPATAGGRFYGYGTHPNLYGHSLMMGVAACVACFDWSRSVWWRRVWAGSAVVMLLGIFQSGSRGSFLGVGVAMALYLAFSGRQRLVALAGVGAWCVAIALLAGVVTIPPNSAIGRLLGQGETTQGSNQEREEALDDVVEVITEKPILGDGFTYSIAVHIVYLQYWQSGGAFAGLAVMLLALAMVLLPFGRPRWTLALPCGAAGVAVAWFFTNISGTRDQWIFLVLAFRVVRAEAELAPPKTPETTPAELETVPAPVPA